MSFFTEDLISFYGTIYGGLIIGLLFDVNRVIKNNFKFIKVFYGIFDVIFWFIVTLLSFILINAVEAFDLRYYHFVALFMGFFIYYKTISKFILGFLNIIISTIVKVISRTIKYILKFSESIYYVLIYIIHLIYDFLFFLPSFFSKNKRVKKTKSRINLKIKKKA